MLKVSLGEVENSLVYIQTFWAPSLRIFLGQTLTTNKMIKLRFLPLILLSIACNTSVNTIDNSEIIQNFQNPPNEARPRVWWHWMNGNITKDGIQKDLDWMKRIGIGGFQNFDANLFTPVVVENPLVFMTPEWKDAFLFTTNLADSLGLEMTIAGSPGWSVTGGPWVQPEDAMKKYVWTETIVEGGKTFQGKLKLPSDVAGSFQNVAAAGDAILSEELGETPTYYNDAMIIAYKLPKEDKQIKELNPKVSSSGGNFNLDFLTDGDLNTTKYLPPKNVGDEIWIQYEFDEPQTFKAMSIVGANHFAMESFSGGPLNRKLMISNDGKTYTDVISLSGSINPQNTIAFNPVTAKYWRLCYTTLAKPTNSLIQIVPTDNKVIPEGVEIAEFVLYTSDRIDQFEDKASFTPWVEHTASFLGEATGISTNDVINITDKMQEDGSLNWDIPEGTWSILRFGYSLTGRQNHPASPAGTGLEVDKLDEDAVKRYINTYLDLYKDATGGLMGEKGLKYLILDSYEAGHMTWTHDLPEEFEKRRGYSIDSWIPVLTGRVIGSREASEKFLWDFRKTIGEMIVDNHYNTIGEELNKRGMGRYTESHENKRVYMADGMDVKRNAEVPMAAMWTPGSLAEGANEEVRSEADIREAASVAHIYGKPFVAAESMTSIGEAFSFSPEKLKRTADMEMASGLNRFVIHTSVHQPLNDKMPGFSLGPFGQYFTRQETWSEQANVWIDYLARSCYMLQQGKNVADVLVYYGENTNLTIEFEDKLPDMPGYEFDFVNSSTLKEAISINNGKMITPGGGIYSLLYIDESGVEMTLPVLKKIKELVDNGVVITGTKPLRTPSLSDNAEEFQKLVNEIWAKPNVYNKPIVDVFKEINIEKDVIISGNSSPILFKHRSMPGMEIYWIDNRSVNKNKANISFNVSGLKPELWHPQTGKIKDVSWKIKNGRTEIPLNFESWEAYFIVFREKTKNQENKLPELKEEVFAEIQGSWNLSFQENRGAPESVVLNSLESLTENKEFGIKYFSGTVSYQKNFQLNENIAGANIILDLGKVKNIAEVFINGHNLGVLWKTPFRTDITDYLNTGNNSIEIKVTNLWVNRLIGDQQPGAKEKITFTTMPFYSADSPLLESGLLGPVQLIKLFEE